MAKFYGSVGYAETIQTAPGVHEEQIVEYPYYGDLTRNARQLQSESRSTMTSMSRTRSA